jgi:hypothetical protein
VRAVEFFFLQREYIPRRKQNALLENFMNIMQIAVNFEAVKLG